MHSSQVKLERSRNSSFIVVDNNNFQRNTQIRNKSPLNLLYFFTEGILDLYSRVNRSFRYDTNLNPRRVLTKPSEGKNNDNFDNEKHDLIIYVNDIFESSTSSNRYRVVEILGQGTFGIVVKCVELYTKEQVAVKVIKNRPAYYQQGMIEKQILTELNSKYDPQKYHIVKLLDSFVFRKHLCLVFELLGCNLFELTVLNKYQGFSFNLVRLLLTQILEAQEALLETQIIHCDLKPENILLCDMSSPAIKVIDFGSACKEYQTMFTYIQSRFYRSPEVILGLPYNSTIDIWSIGCIAAELYLGLPLFSGNSEFNQISRIIDMLGYPPCAMLLHGKNVRKYFDHTFDIKSGAEVYTLKSEHQYAMENNIKVQQSKKYFLFNNIPDIIENKAITKKITSQESLDKIKLKRKCFAHFLLGLLQLDPKKRWSPTQALKHPFITKEVFTGSWEPPMPQLYPNVNPLPIFPFVPTNPILHNDIYSPLTSHHFLVGNSPSTNYLLNHPPNPSMHINNMNKMNMNSNINNNMNMNVNNSNNNMTSKANPPFKHANRTHPHRDRSYSLPEKNRNHYTNSNLSNNNYNINNNMGGTANINPYNPNLYYSYVNPPINPNQMIQNNIPIQMSIPQNIPNNNININNINNNNINNNNINPFYNNNNNKISKPNQSNNYQNYTQFSPSSSNINMNNSNNNTPKNYNKSNFEQKSPYRHKTDSSIMTTNRSGNRGKKTTNTSGSNILNTSNNWPDSPQSIQPQQNQRANYMGHKEKSSAVQDTYRSNNKTKPVSQSSSFPTLNDSLDDQKYTFDDGEFGSWDPSFSISQLLDDSDLPYTPIASSNINNNNSSNKKKKMRRDSFNNNYNQSSTDFSIFSTSIGTSPRDSNYLQNNFSQRIQKSSAYGKSPPNQDHFPIYGSSPSAGQGDYYMKKTPDKKRTSQTLQEKFTNFNIDS